MFHCHGVTCKLVDGHGSDSCSVLLLYTIPPRFCVILRADGVVTRCLPASFRHSFLDVIIPVHSHPLHLHFCIFLSPIRTCSSHALLSLSGKFTLYHLLYIRVLSFIPCGAISPFGLGLTSIPTLEQASVCVMMGGHIRVRALVYPYGAFFTV